MGLNFTTQKGLLLKESLHWKLGLKGGGVQRCRDLQEEGPGGRWLGLWHDCPAKDADVRRSPEWGAVRVGVNAESLSGHVIVSSPVMPSVTRLTRQLPKW